MSKALPHSSQAQAILTASLKATEPATTVAFFTFLHAPHAATVTQTGARFHSISPNIALSVSDQHRLSLQQQQAGLEAGLSSVEVMEAVTACCVDLLRRSELDSSRIPALLFLSTLQHLVTVLRRTVKPLPPRPLPPRPLLPESSGNSTSKTHGSAATKFSGDVPPLSRAAIVAGQESETSTTVTSSDLLECEGDAGSMGHSEAFADASLLYLAAALCEHMSAGIVQRVTLSDLFKVLAELVDCHASLCLPDQCVRASSPGDQLSGPGDSELLGGTVTLSIAFGLLSAVLGGGREVSPAVWRLVSVVVL